MREEGIYGPSRRSNSAVCGKLKLPWLLPDARIYVRDVMKDAVADEFVVYWQLLFGVTVVSGHAGDV